MFRGSLFIQTAIFSIAVGNPIVCMSQAVPPNPGEIYKRAAPGVVVIETYNSQGKVAKTGSGFLVTADGRLLTNWHVVAHTKQATVRLANGDAYDTIEVLAVDKRKDIAFLKIPAVELSHLTLGRSRDIEVGQSVFSISTPLGVLQNTLSQGLVSGIREMDGYRAFQMTAPLSRGSSGSPVFNAAGEVIGIAVFLIESGQNLNFAIPIDYARGMLTAQTAQPLATFYEPEPAPEVTPAKPAAKEEDRQQPTKAETSIANTALSAEDQASLRKSSFNFLHTKITRWTLEDARTALGEPTRHRYGYDTNNRVVNDIYTFQDPTGFQRMYELSFDTHTKKMVAVYCFPRNLTWDQLRKIWGDKYATTKRPNGEKLYTYQDRPYTALSDKDGNVTQIIIWALTVR